jgi:hypothetical protein
MITQEQLRAKAEEILTNNWRPLAVAPNPETLESIYDAMLEFASLPSTEEPKREPSLKWEAFEGLMIDYARECWQFAANAYRMYPDNKHRFADAREYLLNLGRKQFQLSTSPAPNKVTDPEKVGDGKRFNNWYDSTHCDDVKAKKPKCDGNCGSNYCDEYGCIENKPDGDVSHLLTKPAQLTDPEKVGEAAQMFFDWVKEYHPNIDISDKKQLGLYTAYCKLKAALNPKPDTQ